ncbi:MAG TPA: gluconate:H+ symporter [Sphingobacteriaceae bacterium]
MSLIIVFLAIVILVILVLKKLNPMLALLIVAFAAGLMLGMPVSGVVASVTSGIGGTLGGMVMVLALGAMIGRLAEKSGAAEKLVQVLSRLFGAKNIQWAVLVTGILVGIPLFYNAGFVVLIPLVFATAAAARIPVLYVGIPMAAALSVTHGFLPPHPGPVALAAIFKADIGLIILYGLLLTIPISIIAGIIFPRLIRNRLHSPHDTAPAAEPAVRVLPGGLKSFLIALMPVLLITIGTLGTLWQKEGPAASVFEFLAEPNIALLLSLLLTLLLLRQPMSEAMKTCMEGVSSVAAIILIIAAGGAFKQVLVDSGIGVILQNRSAALHFSPLFLGWLITAMLRVTLGSATVAALTASGIVAPFIASGVPAELMVLSVGAGSLFFSHVNDTGFWMFKEYFNLSLKQTFRTWTAMESIISVLGLVGVLILNEII